MTGCRLAYLINAAVDVAHIHIGEPQARRDSIGESSTVRNDAKHRESDIILRFKMYFCTLGHESRQA